MSARKESGRRGLLLGAVAVLIAGAIGWLAGSSGAAEEGGPHPPGATALITSKRAGVPVGFPRTREGAAAAVAAYQRAFASASVLRPGVLEDRIRAVATPEYAERMLAANSPGLERLASGPIGSGLARGEQTLYSAVPIGYEVEAFSPARAEILTWGFTLLGNASSVEPAAYFGLSHTELTWASDGWRIARTEAGFGPTPKLATKPGPLGGYGVMNLASHLHSYELAP